MAEKYGPLQEYLLAAAGRGEDSVQLRLREIATLVGGLPASAFNHRAWWANGSHGHAAAWLGAGWSVASVAQPNGYVRFEKRPLGDEGIASPAAGTIRRAHHGSKNAVLDPSTLPVLGQVDVRVTAEWRDAGPIGQDSARELHFPRLPPVPGLYRITLAGARDQTRPRVYIGETEDLRRRAAAYRSPGPTQETNLRLNAKLKGHFAAGGTASMAISSWVTAEMGLGSAPNRLDLSRRASRRLGENAALVAAQHAGDVDVENVD